MEWTAPAKPNNVSSYDHVIAVTPIGKMIIEWKSWKSMDSYDITIEGHWIGAGVDLDDAKDMGEKYLKNKLNELTEYLCN